MMIVCTFGYQLLVDDELNPEAENWLSQVFKEVDLENNAYLSLAALGGRDSELAYDVVRQSYQDAVGQIKFGTLDPHKKFKYPNLNGLVTVLNDTKYCSFELDGCLVNMRESLPYIWEELADYFYLSQQLNNISDFDNFAALNPIATVPDFESLDKVFQLSSIETFLLIEEGEYDKAQRRLSRLIKLLRQLSANSGDATFLALPVIHFVKYYVPLIDLLLVNGHRDFKETLEALSPLSINEITMNRIWLQLFATGATPIKFEYLAADVIKGSNPLDKLLARIKYKENITINAMFNITKIKLIPESAPKLNIHKLLSMRQEKVDYLEKEVRDSMSSDLAYFIKNYRNYAGGHLLAVSSPKFLNATNELQQTDLLFLLQKAKILAKSKSIIEIINLPEFINPYTGMKPRVEQRKLCYFLQNDICDEIPIH